MDILYTLYFCTVVVVVVQSKVHTVLLIPCYIFNFSVFHGSIRESSEQHVDQEPQKGVKRGKI